ncbi:phosphotransferase family protein [Candidatus Formimonas warabiya]|uniref:Aminoglycoside phosphotransferase n=1 Tax=Formimonas warabiya TaxID=1761012 RepID=A0A3G1KMF6_FORW1|nr:aminoglycoside phosphotransferase family protein [Candidatus Formimonas warabiya]ATW23641.1 aminoglycoside phosphotransferase [Candidatus Formimonas warabiya]
MLNERLLGPIKAYVNSHQFRCGMDLNPGKIEVRFLAQGEYNLNYLLETTGGKYVLRVNTASQMKLENQIAYEYQVLQLLNKSGVTPRPFYLDDRKQTVPYGLLVMEYLPGEPLDYRYDLPKAARTFARIHSLEFGAGAAGFLMKQTGPFTGVYQEAVTLLESFFNCPDADVQIKWILERALLKAEEKKKDEDFLLHEPWLAVINTEVNSHNFIVNQERLTCHLIDWEKPIYGEPAQDLSMFLIATTTMWKRNYVLSVKEEEEFLAVYLNCLATTCPYKNTLRDRVQMFKLFNYLRAISWCAMAWTEYTKPGRPLVNRDTFEKIKAYLEPEFIRTSLLNLI